MNKHVSVIKYSYRDELNVVIWRGDKMKEYWATPSSVARLTLFCWMNKVPVTPHFDSMSVWFDFPN